ncbi:MAG TPA: bifunctional DNA primase/polymerase [Candidatus Limnocylindrales bacterium]|nr:bifunctional DNA primase/polymerase [Candidatus Limnocylindrales bacterium]
MSAVLTAALAYAATGWPVFLLGRSKRPLANCANCSTNGEPGTHDPQACKCVTCHGFYAATRDRRSIKRMVAIVPSGMLAIRTGAASGLVVVDVDPGKGGSETLLTLVKRGLCPPTRFVRTGSGGLHLYYQHPGAHSKIPNSAGKLGPGIDVRGDGGYVVAPPSVHPRTRQTYDWADERAAIEEMAPALAALCITPDPPAAPTAGRPSSLRSAGAISYPDRLLAALLNKVRTAPPGRRRVTLYGCARGVARMVAAGVIGPIDGQAALLEVGLAVGQTERSALAAITGGFADEGVIL